MVWHRGVQTGIAGFVALGAAIVLLGIGGFGAWAAMAPLEGAVISSGKVVVAGRNKIVQHLEGGIVRQVLVQEGDRVAAGDPLVLLDTTAAETQRNRLQIQSNMLMALEARLLAERGGFGSIDFPAELADDQRTETSRTLEDQRSEFQARLERHEAELAILRQKADARGEEILGLEAQMKAVDSQLQLVVDEKNDAENLLSKGLATKPRVLELKRHEADFLGQSGQLTAARAQAQGAIAEIAQEVQRLTIARAEEANARLAEVRLQLADTQERLRTAQDALDRIIISAPVAGMIININHHNAGAVITPGQFIMEIVPEEAERIVEARVSPHDIDEVRVGQQARLVFAAFSQREVPPLPAEVIHVSADRIEDARSGEAYYLARLQISSEPAADFDMSRIGAGHAVDVFVTTRQRTFLSYLIEPIAKTLVRAARE